MGSDVKSPHTGGAKKQKVDKVVNFEVIQITEDTYTLVELDADNERVQVELPHLQGKTATTIDQPEGPETPVFKTSTFSSKDIDKQFKMAEKIKFWDNENIVVSASPEWWNFQAKAKIFVALGLVAKSHEKIDYKMSLVKSPNPRVIVETDQNIPKGLLVLTPITTKVVETPSASQLQSGKVFPVDVHDEKYYVATDAGKISAFFGMIPKDNPKDANMQILRIKVVVGGTNVFVPVAQSSKVIRPGDVLTVHIPSVVTAVNAD